VLEGLKKRQEEDQAQARQEVEEEVAQREQGLETQKQAMLAKLEMLQVRPLATSVLVYEALNCQCMRP
jgi:hypothetical protein